jgi:hypothetical protein
MGKSSAPPAPDYAAAAEQKAAGDLEMARYATQANRPNQYTPWGSLVWERGPSTSSFNQQAYDDAYRQWQQSQGGGGGGGSLSGEEGGSGLPGGSSFWGRRLAALGQGGAAGSAAPDRNDPRFWSESPSDQWSQRISLTPEAQETLDKQMRLSNRYADLATLGLDKAEGLLSDPTLDMSQIPDRAINVGQTAQEAILARLNPQFAQQEEALRARLANQGIGVGSEAFGNDFRQFNQKRNDAELQAALYGIGLDDQNRKSALAEQAYLQDRPLNLINALRSGAQVQNPTFPSFAQQGTTAGPNYLGAADAQYGAAVDAANAENAGLGGMMGGLFSLGGAALGSPWLGGALGFPGMGGR